MKIVGFKLECQDFRCWNFKRSRKKKLYFNNCFKQGIFQCYFHFSSFFHLFFCFWQHNKFIVQFTNNWAPPEAFIEPVRLSSASDVFSFGMILFEVLTGCLPWNKTNEFLIPNQLLNGKIF